MRPPIAFASVTALGLLAAASWLAGSAQEPAIAQPLEFNHAVHAKEGIACDDCHPKADEGPFATFPSLKQCLLCHKPAEEGEEPEAGQDPALAARLADVAARLNTFAELGEGVPWVQVNRVVGHVYFSHVAHVRFGEMKCEECHGDMSAATRPPQHSQIEDLSMERCMECHAQREVSNDCLVCHK